MKSIREIYKIGKGPSSSHTMGPERAAKLFLERYPQADRFQVTLYGSLSKTGVGHGTDRVLLEVLGEDRTEVIFSQEAWEGMHPNTLDLAAFSGDTGIGQLRVESIGGGDIRYPGQAAEKSEEVYIEHSFAEIADFCKWRYIHTLSEYVELNEGPEIWDFLMEVWLTMKKAIDEGLQAEGVLPGGLNVQRKAKSLYEQKLEVDEPALREFQLIAAFAYAVAEQNAGNGTVVTAPTCGACGVLPAVLKYAQITKGYTDEQICRGLATAGIIGNLTKRNASISGAEAGCQAEIGSASAMAAAALVYLHGGNEKQMADALAIALKNMMGLVCDPVAGLVEVPCVKRNAAGAVNAITAAEMALAGIGSYIPADEVIDAMRAVGDSMPSALRETGKGGIAASPTAVAFAEKFYG